MGVWQGLIIFFVTFIPFEYSSNIGGMGSSLWMEGTLCYAGVCVIVNFYILQCSHSHSIFSSFVIFGSILIFFLIFLIMGGMKSSDLYGTFIPLLSQPEFWFIIIFLMAAFYLLNIMNRDLVEFLRPFAYLWDKNRRDKLKVKSKKLKTEKVKVRRFRKSTH
jgi:hypothetical protein